MDDRDKPPPTRRKFLTAAAGASAAFAGAPALAGDPRVELYDNAGASVETNDNWGGSVALRDAFAAAGVFALASGSTDAALLRTISGRNTVHFATTTNGAGLLEMYDLGAGRESRLANISVRHSIGTGPDAALVLGFTISGPSDHTVLIRGVGPGIAAAAASAIRERLCFFMVVAPCVDPGSLHPVRPPCIDPAQSVR